jgi:hypothetical protein
MQQIAFNGNRELAGQYVAHAQAHYDADMLRAGTYGEGSGKAFKACSIGCFAHDLSILSDWHAGLAQHYAVPEWLLRLQDSMFEGLPKSDRASFHVDLARRVAACAGRDLSRIPNAIAVRRLDRMLAEQRKALEADHAHGVAEAIQQVIATLEAGRRLHEAMVAGTQCDLSSLESAARSAESAASAASAARSAESAAWSAAAAAWSAWSAARSAESAAWSAESAAWSAAASAASAARSAAWRNERDALYQSLEVLAESQP